MTDIWQWDATRPQTVVNRILWTRTQLCGRDGRRRQNVSIRTSLTLISRQSGLVAHSMQISTVCLSANLLFVTRCNLSFGARGFRSAAPAIPLTSIVAKLSEHSADPWNLIRFIQPLPLPSDPSQRLWFHNDYGTYKSRLLTYLVTYLKRHTLGHQPDDTTSHRLAWPVVISRRSC